MIRDRSHRVKDTLKSPGPEIDQNAWRPNASQQVLEKLETSIKEVEDFSGLDFNVFDDISVEKLPEGVPAATRNGKYQVPLIGSIYDRTELVLDPELAEMPRWDRNHALLHEDVHGHYFKDKEKEALDKAGLYGEDRDKIEYLLNSGDESAFEGSTEFITHLLDPESQRVGKKFYPGEMEAVQEELDSDSELVEDIRGLKHELLENYTEVYDIETSEGLYRESGNFAGVDYDVTVIGEDAEDYGEEVVNEYLEEVANYMKDGAYGLDDSGQLFEDNAINWEGWDEKLNYTEGM